MGEATCNGCDENVEDCQCLGGVVQGAEDHGAFKMVCSTCRGFAPCPDPGAPACPCGGAWVVEAQTVGAQAVALAMPTFAGQRLVVQEVEAVDPDADSWVRLSVYLFKHRAPSEGGTTTADRALALLKEREEQVLAIMAERDEWRERHEKAASSFAIVTRDRDGLAADLDRLADGLRQTAFGLRVGDHPVDAALRLIREKPLKLAREIDRLGEYVALFAADEDMDVDVDDPVSSAIMLVATKNRELRQTKERLADFLATQDDAGDGDPVGSVIRVAEMHEERADGASAALVLAAAKMQAAEKALESRPTIPAPESVARDLREIARLLFEASESGHDGKKYAALRGRRLDLLAIADRLAPPANEDPLVTARRNSIESTIAGAKALGEIGPRIEAGLEARYPTCARQPSRASRAVRWFGNVAMWAGVGGLGGLAVAKVIAEAVAR